jgi:hypothetical protein
MWTLSENGRGGSDPQHVIWGEHWPVTEITRHFKETGEILCILALGKDFLVMSSSVWFRRKDSELDQK